MIIPLLHLLLLSCPHIEPKYDLNVTEYISKTWYIQQQQITGYQPENSLYCVAQTLNNSMQKVPFFDGKIVSVYNYGNLNSVNGTNENPNNFTLCARKVNASNNGQFLNAPCFLPNFFAGPYWVLDAGPNNTHYEWAIISESVKKSVVQILSIS